MTLNSILVVIAVILLFSGVATFFQNLLRVYLKMSIKRKYTFRLLELLGKMDYRQFLNSSTGYFNNLIVCETDRAMAAFESYCVLIATIISITVYVWLAMLLSWQIATVGIVCSGIVMFSMKSIFRRSSTYDLKNSKMNALLQEHLIQAIQYFKYLKSTNNFKKLQNKIESTINSIISLKMKKAFLNWTLRVVLQLFAPFIVIAMIYYMVSIKGNSVGSVIVLALIFYKTISSLTKFQKNWQSFLSKAGGLITVENAYKRVSRNIEKNGVFHLDSFRDSIVMKHVSYAYSDIEVLHNMNIKIDKNSTIAIVGESGAGKSTFVDLITGVLKPTTGQILLDGKDYTDIKLSSLRDMIGYVTQEIIVFNDTIANNISLWSQEKSQTEFVEPAARHASCEEFIQETPDQYDTHIGDRGFKLSGGQRQRLAIARELYKEPEILILDEATSALDTKSEVFIRNSIDTLKHNKTIIIIAHRLSTVRTCDYIYVFNKGRIIEHGTYDDLYNNEESSFRNMCDMQSLWDSKEIN